MIDPDKAIAILTVRRDSDPGIGLQPILSHLDSIVPDLKRWSDYEYADDHCESYPLRLEGDLCYLALLNQSGNHTFRRPSNDGGGEDSFDVHVEVLPWVTEDLLDITQEDLEVKIYRSPGAGGQHVGVRNSSISVNHIPTGFRADLTGRISMFRMRDMAMMILRGRILGHRFLQVKEHEIT